MRVPTIIIGRFKIRYIQVVYDDRYFVYSRKNDDWKGYRDFAKISQIDPILNLELHDMIIKYGMDHLTDQVELKDRHKRMMKFLKKVKEKDKYLDDKEEKEQSR